MPFVFLHEELLLFMLAEDFEFRKAVAFLASDDASYITGVELNIDGGMGQL